MNDSSIGKIILGIIAIIAFALFIAFLIRIAWSLILIGLALIALFFIAKTLEFIFGE